MFLNKDGARECNYQKVVDLAVWRATRQATVGVISASAVIEAEWNFAVGAGAALFKKLRQMPVKLGNVATRMYQGPITSADTVYLFKDHRPGKKKGLLDVFSKELDDWVTMEAAILKAVVRSGDIGRYSAAAMVFVLFPYEVRDYKARLFSVGEMQSQYPLAWAYLNRHKELLEHREKGKFKDAEWYRFGRTQNLGIWEQPKLMIPYMIKRLAAYLDLDDSYYFINVTTGGYGITAKETYSLEYLCGLINSRLLDFCFKYIATTFHGGYFAANKQYIEQLPIRPINLFDSADKAQHHQIVSFVDQMLELNKKLAESKMPQATEMLKRQIDATDRQIDDLVYKLYDVTDEEIKIVESET